MKKKFLKYPCGKCPKILYTKVSDKMAYTNSADPDQIESDGRDANHSDFCGIVPIFKSDFHITISDIKILANNDFKMVPDKIKEVAPPCTPLCRKLYLFVCSKIWLFPFKNQTDLCIVYWKNITVAGKKLEV